MDTTWRVWLAFLVAPLVTPITFLATYRLRGGNVWFPLPVFFYIAIFAYAAAVVLGGPAFLLFCFLRQRSLILFSLAGGLIGLTVFVSFSLWLGWGSVKLPLLFVIAGSLSAFVFRMIVGGKPFVASAPLQKQID